MLTVARVPLLLLAAAVFLASPLLADQRGGAAGRRQGQSRQPNQPRAAQGDLNVGDLAPDFALAPRDGGDRVALSSFRGRSPVALVFGSYT